jgi:hypothetical protein
MCVCSQCTEDVSRAVPQALNNYHHRYPPPPPVLSTHRHTHTHTHHQPSTTNTIHCRQQHRPPPHHAYRVAGPTYPTVKRTDNLTHCLRAVVLKAPRPVKHRQRQALDRQRTRGDGCVAVGKEGAHKTAVVRPHAVFIFAASVQRRHALESFVREVKVTVLGARESQNYHECVSANSEGGCVGGCGCWWWWWWWWSPWWSVVAVRDHGM